MGERLGEITKVSEEMGGGEVDMFIIFPLVMVSQKRSYIKTHPCVGFKHALFFIYHLHLQKVGNKCKKKNKYTTDEVLNQ